MTSPNAQYSQDVYQYTGGITRGWKFYSAVEPPPRTTHIFRDFMYL